MLLKVMDKLKKSKSEESTFEKEIIDQIKALEEELKVKYNNFNFVDKKYTDVAINEINLIRQKHTILLRELKEIYLKG